MEDLAVSLGGRHMVLSLAFLSASGGVGLWRSLERGNRRLFIVSSLDFLSLLVGLISK